MNLFAIDEPTTPYDELIVDENGVREIQSVHFVVPPGTAYLPNDAPRKFYDKTHLKIK